MESSSSSKVTVEYHDPSGVFPLVSNDISARLPLRKLNWQSPSRPLRQIRQLHLDFIPDNYTQSGLRPPLQNADSNGPNSFDIVRSGRDQRKEGVKERRHQIPGLKTSPYLKIYVVRCDDKDTYKGTERKKIREWIRDNAQGETKRENHDTFEWLILHIVVPGTVAASESRWREATSSKDEDELKERKTSGAKWPGKSTKTVFDRLRADFNESGKSGQDRVAQIRLLKSDVPPDLLPTPAAATTLEETPQERDKAWKDLVDKLKVLILGPFDARVRQYEVDIAAQESRRSLPGWNFCTFFIHKEGLAKALESIGLVEDALVIYDELSLGLESVVRDIASGKAEGTATTFASYTDDIEARILRTEKAVVNGNSDVHGASDRQVVKSKLFDKEYREQIVRSTISIFDFFCYLFFRQKSLILRLAGTRASRAELGAGSKDGGEDVVLVSEVCWRTSSFLHNIARTLRQDLSSRPAGMPVVDVEALVSCWTYEVADIVLSETAASVLDPANQPESNKILANGSAKPKRPDFSFGMGANPYPERSTSLAVRKPAPELQRPLPKIVVEDAQSPPSSSGTDITTTTTTATTHTITSSTTIPGLPELATYRAELLMMQRKMIEILAKSHGWLTGLDFVRHERRKAFTEVDLNQNEDDIDLDAVSPANESREARSSVVSPLLSFALESEGAFQAVYEDLSDQSMRLFAQAAHTKHVEAIIADFALLKAQQGKFETAAEYFKNVLPTYATDSWSVIEAEILSSYAKCLKELDRKDEYVKTILDILLKVRERRTAKQSTHASSSTIPSALGDDDVFDASGLLSDLIKYSSGLSTDVILPMEQFFTDIHLEPEVRHHQDTDGFSLRLTFRHLLDDDVEADQVSARLVSADDPNQEIWLVYSGGDVMRPGMVTLDLEANVVTFGTYLVDKIMLQTRKLHFVREYKTPHPKLVTPLGIIEPEDRTLESVTAQPSVLLYPDVHAFEVEIKLSKHIHIHKPRHLEVILSSRRNAIDGIDLRLKPFSAGLRLHLADATFEGITGQHQAGAKQGQLGLGSLNAHDTAIVKIPYTVETRAEVAVRLEARYSTSRGSFTFLTSARHPHELSLDVDVNDFFQLDTLFSNFTVRTTNRVPLYLTNVELGESPVYNVEAPPLYGMPMPIFRKQPSNLTYKISRKVLGGEKISKRDAALSMQLDYKPVDEMLRATMKSQFEAALSQSSFGHLSRLLLALLAERSKVFFGNADLDLAVVWGTHRVPTYEELGWQDMIPVLPRAVQSDVADWLRAWHNGHTQLSLTAISDEVQHITRSITLSVDVPTIDVVHRVSLSGQANTPQTSAENAVATLGKSVEVDLEITSTDAWSAKRLLGEREDSRVSSARFVYDIQADSEVWLIGGQRRAHFRIASGETFHTSLTLIPLRTGHLTIPNVEVHAEIEVEAANEKTTRPGGQGPSVSCETHYVSAGRTFEVIQDRRMVEAYVADGRGDATAESAMHAKQPSRSSVMTRSTAEHG